MTITRALHDLYVCTRTLYTCTRIQMTAMLPKQNEYLFVQTKNLYKHVERLMDYSICRLLYVVFVCVSLYHTIP